MKKVTVKNLRRSAGAHIILSDVSAEFQPGRVNVIIGPNGAGKTSLLRLIALLDRPDQGSVLFDGVSAFSLSRRGRLGIRRGLGYVFQHPLVLSGSVRFNLEFALRVRREPVDHEKIFKVLHDVRLGQKIDDSASTLSGGEKQRLQLARILLLDPPVLLFDEPTANLDPVSSREIESLISSLASRGKTILLSTHNLFQARQLGHYFYYLQQGSLIQEGPAEVIFRTPLTLDIASYSSAENVMTGELVYLSGSPRLMVNGLAIEASTGLKPGPAYGIIRPEDILISREPIVSSARNSFPGKITLIQDLGIMLGITVLCGSQPFLVYITRESADHLELAVDKPVYLTFKATALHLISHAG